MWFMSFEVSKPAAALVALAHTTQQQRARERDWSASDIYGGNRCKSIRSMCATDDVGFIWVEGETIMAGPNLEFGQTLFQPKQRCPGFVLDIAM